MDLFTLSLCTVLLSAMMAITLSALFLTNTADKAMRDWSLAGVCFLACSLLILVASVRTVPWLLTPVLSNTLYIAAHGLVLSGITSQTRSVNSHLSIGVFSAFVLLMHFNDAISSNVEFRMLAIYPVMLTLNLLSVFHLWRFRHSAHGKSYWAVMTIILLFIAHTAGSAVAILLFPDHLEFLGSDIIQTTNSLVVLLYISGLTLGLIFVHAWKREVTLKTVSRTDALTGWFNRHALNESASREFIRCQRNQLSFAFVTFDIDFFKNVNDRYGHTTGDRAIRHIANVAREATREYDYHFRLGGEEFVIMLAGLKVSDVKAIAERVRFAIQSTPLCMGIESLTLSVSVGMATMEQGDLGWHVVLERADDALYAAKKGGRNNTRFLTANALSLVKG
ncbi:GGDEF domain-containing protein [Alteromonas sp. 1_MG-2023]|uniref:GGDEF domain-containing protein n=1 Tax=Alteromonas sp. 1_MG-2023 TaxID=3062669 RepID=UPI0026E436FE|nr:GGDEF domain-containing protein [Alteromonas sp. 1_MG-2023]MDO6475818.1 GGDEF domain-containing protein [Alteromonas sp. 1_MG-2023]